MAAKKKSGQVLVVNMIPRALSRETNQDSEPSITVNPANPLEIVGTACDSIKNSMAKTLKISFPCTVYTPPPM